MRSRKRLYATGLGFCGSSPNENGFHSFSLAALGSLRQALFTWSGKTIRFKAFFSPSTTHQFTSGILGSILVTSLSFQFWLFWHWLGPLPVSFARGFHRGGKEPRAA